MSTKSNYHVQPLVDLSEDIEYIDLNLNTICALCVKRKKQILLTLYNNTETKIIFEALIGGFKNIKSNYHRIYKYQFIDLHYSLFTKKLTQHKDIIFLMEGNHKKYMIQSFDIIDCLQHYIVDLYKWIKLPNQMVQIAKTFKNHQENELSKISIIEILQEAFAGNDYPLNELEFMICMQVRCGLDNIWNENTPQKLQILYKNIIKHIDPNEYQTDYEDDIYVKFGDFVNFFTYNQNNIVYITAWKQIKSAIADSPLAEKNQLDRNIDSLTAKNYKQKLLHLKTLIELFEAGIVFHEMEDIEYIQFATDIKQEISHKIYEKKCLFQIENYLRQYCRKNRKYLCSKHYEVIKSINIINDKCGIPFQCDASVLIAGYIKLINISYILSAYISNEIEQIIYLYFEPYTVISVICEHKSDSEISELSDEISQLSDSQNNHHSFDQFMMNWLISWEHGRFGKYCDVLVNGFNEYGIFDVDDLCHLCSAELSEPPFSIKKFMDKRDLIKYFQSLKNEH
eukprot:455164_1